MRHLKQCKSNIILYMTVLTINEAVSWMQPRAVSKKSLIISGGDEALVYYSLKEGH